MSDDSTHVRNVYLVKAGNTKPIAVSNTLTAVSTFDFDPERNELLFSELSSSGRTLQSTPWQIYHLASLNAVKMDPPPEVITTDVKVEEENYQPIKYLIPKYWVPFVYTVENGGLLFEGTSSMSDPAGRNNYSLFGAVDTITQRPSYGINYVNSSLPTDIGLSYSKVVTYLGASNYTLESESAAVSFGSHWPIDRHDFKWTVGGVTNTTQSAITYRRIGPNVGAVYDRIQNPLNSWNGFLAEFSYQDYVRAESDDTAYDRTYGHLADVVQLGGGHKLFLQARGAVSPNLPFSDVLDLGDRNVGANYMVNLANSDFLLRGYPSGTFVGRKILSANLEYSLPLFDVARGYGSFPLFLKTMELVLFTDALSVDGGGFVPALNAYVRTDLSQYFMGTGAELRLNTTAGYHLPLTFILGAYYGLNQQYGGGFTPFLGFGLGEFSALQE